MEKLTRPVSVLHILFPCFHLSYFHVTFLKARRFGEMETISWFKSYREIDGLYNEAVSLVAKKLDISEEEAKDRITSQESEIITIQSPEGKDFII